MTEWRYTAIDGEGERVSGTMEGADEAEVVATIRRLGHLPLGINPVKKGGFRPLLRIDLELPGRGMLTRQEVTHFSRELAVMLGAGQDLEQALRFLVETAPNRRYARSMEALLATVRDGNSLHATLSQHPGTFPPLMLGLVRSAEAGGNLAETMERIAVLQERERALVATLQSAMIYPALLFLTAIGSIGLLLTQVLPQFVPLFAQSGAALPPSTQLLVSLGDVVEHYGLAFLLLLLGVMLLLWRLRTVPPIRLQMERLCLRTPVLGALLREAMAARLTQTLGTLLSNGVPLIVALGITRDVIGNGLGVAAFERATEVAKGGGGFARSLGADAVFPPRMVHLLRLGEETARLAPVALQAAEIHEANTRMRVQRLVALLVPAITVVMGAVVAWIVASLMLAMLSLNDLAH